ncbi:hypothetical protein [Sphingomonas nostoxanthinifaciens]|uniref:hypothetical protein n=1 Tax=Sphingomonas nostoxanthinifaciens TaxID=2872652 RepID=UPI001CC20865|nr:hypothetical protein [Sphingomonas nostoxanthinifaciens]UAK26305.1 hypothetical protein K8P63_09565 [Sphingomonas nostoxanthinifaciens]
MAGIDGKWECSVETPMGDQAFVLTVVTAGDRFSGSVSGAIGAKEIDDGDVDGDTIRWSMSVPKPMPVTLTCQATAEGDTISGKMKAGIFGSFALTGTRAG